MTNEHYVVGLRDDQWELIVDALAYVRARSEWEESKKDVIDRCFCRQHARKSIDAVIREICSNVSHMEPSPHNRRP